jgi:ribose transport system permease protein
MTSPVDVTAPQAPGREGGTDARRGRDRVRPTTRRNPLERYAMLFLAVVLYAVFSLISPHVFFTGANARVMVTSQATTLLLALAATLILRAGQFDVSLSAIMILSGCLVGVLSGKYGVPPWAAVIVALLAGGIAGALNGFFVVVVGVDGLVVTLGMLTLLMGVGNAISSSNLVTSIPPALVQFAGRRFLQLPVVVWIGWGTAAILWYVFEFTPVGRSLLFVGGNLSTARLAGLRVTSLRVWAFVAAGLMSALAGVLLAGTLGSMDPGSGGAYLLSPYAAAFLGATAILPGRFNIAGTLVGLYLLTIGITGLNLIGVQSWVSDVFYGAALIIAVTFAKYSGGLSWRLFAPRRHATATATAKQDAGAVSQSGRSDRETPRGESE